MTPSTSLKPKKPAKPKVPVKDSLRKAFNDLLSAPNHEQKMRRFAECLINYQLYAELHAYDNKQKQKALLDGSNESEATASEETLQKVRINHGLHDLKISEDEIEPPSFKDSVREMFKHQGSELAI